jgi:hypothetical protein
MYSLSILAKLLDLLIVVLGGANAIYYNGELKTYPLISASYWVIATNNFKVGNEEIAVE